MRAWLLEWINDNMKNHKVRNFKSDWWNGVALGALVDGVAPGMPIIMVLQFFGYISYFKHNISTLDALSSYQRQDAIFKSCNG